MRSSIGYCTQCGAQGEIGTKCEYCGYTVSAPQPQGGHSVIESWGDYHLDGFSIVDDNIEGDTDFPEFQVIQGDRTGKFGMVNKFGIVIMPCIYDYLKVYLDYNLCSVSKDYCHAVFNTEGQVIIPFEEINPLGVFLFSDDLIVGYNTVYDLQGNLKIRIPAEHRVILLSNLYASTIQKRGIYSLESGEMILSDDYKVDQIISTHYVIVNKVFDGFTRYGIFDCEHKAFVLETEFSSIQEESYGRYVAMSQAAQYNSSVKSRTLTLSLKGNKLTIEKEGVHNFSTGGTGCVVIFIPLLLPLLYFLL